MPDRRWARRPPSRLRDVEGARGRAASAPGSRRSPSERPRTARHAANTAARSPKGRSSKAPAGPPRPSEGLRLAQFREEAFHGRGVSSIPGRRKRAGRAEVAFREPMTAPAQVRARIAGIEESAGARASTGPGGRWIGRRRREPSAENTTPLISTPGQARRRPAGGLPATPSRQSKPQVSSMTSSAKRAVTTSTPECGTCGGPLSAHAAYPRGGAQFKLDTRPACPAPANFLRNPGGLLPPRDVKAGAGVFGGRAA